MSEILLMRNLQVLASKIGARLFRQQAGTAWTGKSVMRVSSPRPVMCEAGDVIVRSARPFKSGFEGWSDLGGFVPVEITPDMVGQTVAVYLQVEVKDKARPTPEQLAWIRAVNAAGGRAGIARSPEDLAEIIGKKIP